MSGELWYFLLGSGTGNLAPAHGRLGPSLALRPSTRLVFRNSIARLEKANADAYHSGCQVASASYQSLSQRYLAELWKPSITFRSTLRLVTAAGLGFLAGRVVR